MGVIPPYFFACEAFLRNNIDRLHTECSVAPSAAVIFAKVPEPGRVKTRLVGMLLPRQAVEIHGACLEDTIALVARVPGCRKWLQVAAGPEPAQRLAAVLEIQHPWRVGVQRGRNLGERLHQAFASLFDAGYGRVVIVGTDTPWMGSRRIARAFAVLDAADVVIGPTSDGGYYLVGARRLCPQMFRGIPWSTSQAFGKTLEALEKIHASYRLLPRDFDLDRPEDLERTAELLRRDATLAPALARFLKKFKREKVNKSSRRR